MKYVLVPVVLLISLSGCGSRPLIGLSDEALTLEPDKDFEAKLNAIAKELDRPTASDEASLLAYYNQLVDKSGVPPAEFILKTISIARGDVGDMIFLAPIRAAAAKLSPEEVLRTVGPYAGTEKHKEMVWDAVMSTLQENKLGTAEQCANLLMKYGSNIPRGLMDVFYYYLQPPDAATMCARVFAVSDSDQKNSLKQIDSLAPYIDWNSMQLSGDARAELLKRLPVLIESNHWWVRRYAADAIYRYRELQQPELLQPLLRDTEPLVTQHLKRQDEELRRMRERFN